VGEFISRADALSLIREQNATEIWQAAVQSSAALRSFRRVNMGKKISNYPTIGSIPEASFVSGEDADDANSRKPVTSMKWGNRKLVAEEIAGIVVIPENVILDAESEFSLWGEVRPRIAEAVGRTLDGAVFFGVNAPSTWPAGLVPTSIAVGNVVTEGTTIPEGAGAQNDLAADVSATFGVVEDDGYDPRAAYGRRSLARRLRGLRDANNAPIYVQTLAEDGSRIATIDQATFYPVMNGSWDNSEATMLCGDPDYAILGIRQDIEYKFLDQAAVTIGGELVSLAENDLLGLRFKMRVGFQTAETMTAVNPQASGEGRAYPFAVLQPAGS
jgi:HK97 family phage major capsid protein